LPDTFDKEKILRVSEGNKKEFYRMIFFFDKNPVSQSRKGDLV